MGESTSTFDDAVHGDDALVELGTVIGGGVVTRLQTFVYTGHIQLKQAKKHTLNIQ